MNDRPTAGGKGLVDNDKNTLGQTKVCSNAGFQCDISSACVFGDSGVRTLEEKKMRKAEDPYES